MTRLEDILARALRELGPDASDEDLKAKVLEVVESLPDVQKRKCSKRWWPWPAPRSSLIFVT